MAAPSTEAGFDSLSDLRHHLIESGYTPIPVRGKRPMITGWSSLQPDHQQVAQLVHAHPDHTNTGLLTGDVVAIDVDVLDQETATRIQSLVRALPGGDRALRRVGRAPKALFLFHATEPREKRATEKYRIAGEVAQVEVLGVGQQFVAFGTHPETGAPYEWTTSSPLDVALADLPSITPEDVDHLVLQATAVLAEVGTPLKAPPERRERAETGTSTFWREVNSAALEQPDRWVSDLFPSARREAATGAWRVTSAQLGRSLEEDISIHSSGIRDFGIEQPRTAIDLVSEWGGVPTPADAALWLCDKLAIDPETLGWRVRAVPSISYTTATPPAPANDNHPTGPELVSSGDFVRGFVPPDYAVDGIIQTGFLYSLTGQTGSGKTAAALLLAACTALGRDFAGRETRQARVFYFAGENPDDVTMRWIGLCHALGLDADDLDVHFIRGVFSVTNFLEHIRTEAERLGGVGLIIVDTTAAYFTGTDENNNVEMGAYARQLRELAKLRWRPAVLAASHPVKNAAADNLLPRGGGAFLNEVDGNLTLAKRGETSAMHWQGKHRGPDFAPLTFDMRAIEAPALVDSRGRPIPTVMAVPVGDEEVTQRADAASQDDEQMLIAIRQDGSRSLREQAEFLGWMTADGEGNKKRAQMSTDRLKRMNFVTHELRTWKLTRKGEDAATEAAGRISERERCARSAETLIAGTRRRRGRTNRRTEPDEVGTAEEYA
ncbi:AAA family ATPase [Xanthobacteraceae bacterium A53D]